MGENEDHQAHEANSNESNEPIPTIIPDIDISTYQERGLNTDGIEKKEGLIDQ